MHYEKHTEEKLQYVVYRHGSLVFFKFSCSNGPLPTFFVKHFTNDIQQREGLKK